MKDCTNCIHYCACAQFASLSTMERFCHDGCGEFESQYVVKFRPDGKHELDTCQYRICEEHKNVDIEVCQCKDCGRVDISWIRRYDTKSTYFRPVEGETKIQVRMEEEDG